MTQTELNKYIVCVDQIKARIMELGKLLASPHLARDELLLEKIALNYRGIFELIIHACQIAHAHKLNKASKSWNINDVESVVRKNNSDYFMKAVSSEPTTIQPRADRPTLTLDDLKNGYTLTSEWLHATNPLGRPRTPQTSLAEFARWYPLINNLLEAHLVQVDDSHFLYCCLNAAGSGRTHASFFKKISAI